MDSVDKLREYAAYNCRVKGWKDDLKSLADGIEAEVESEYMKLPVDADGVPIHVGDVMEAFDCPKQDYARFVVGGYTSEFPEGKGVLMVESEPDDGAWYGRDIRHVKPRTLEDVLRDCCNEWNEHCGDDWGSSVYAKYAAEIRELLIGGDAE